jgi:anti-anti-sigma regulatory factor
VRAFLINATGTEYVLRVGKGELSELDLGPRLWFHLPETMFLPTINRARQLLYLSFFGQVDAAQIQSCREEVSVLLDELSSGFKCVSDLSQLESISTDCAPEIGKLMELCDAKGVGLVIRVIPDATKDIGLNILTLFHYRKAPQTVTCNTLAEAARLLSL